MEARDKKACVKWKTILLLYVGSFYSTLVTCWSFNIDLKLPPSPSQSTCRTGQRSDVMRSCPFWRQSPVACYIQFFSLQSLIGNEPVGQEPSSSVHDVACFRWKVKPTPWRDAKPWTVVAITAKQSGAKLPQLSRGTTVFSKCVWKEPICCRKNEGQRKGSTSRLTITVI